MVFANWRHLKHVIYIPYFIPFMYPKRFDLVSALVLYVERASSKLETGFVHLIIPPYQAFISTPLPSGKRNRPIGSIQVFL